ncbi:MAG: glutaminyl-peptide cyclotransferase [Acidobacteriota bacterium]
MALTATRQALCSTRAARIAIALLCVGPLNCDAADSPKPPVTVNAPVKSSSAVEHLVVRVRASWPHDPKSFTQGLVWSDGTLYESVGEYGSSALLEVELESGRAVRRVELDAKYFGEGLALAGDRLVQLTWREGQAFVYSRRDFAPLSAPRYEGEGWGLTWDGSALWMSDGSDTLTVRDAKTLAVLARHKVTIEGRPRDYLNELEWVNGKIFANVWQSDTILRIDPQSGRVEAVIDASGLLAMNERTRVDVLNGIAYDASRKVFLITGKLWPKLFEVDFVSRPALRP